MLSPEGPRRRYPPLPPKGLYQLRKWVQPTRGKPAPGPINRDPWACESQAVMLVTAFAYAL